MFDRKATAVSGLQTRLDQARGDCREGPEGEKSTGREELFSRIRPVAQKRIQEKVTVQELADRHSPALRAKVRMEILEIVEQESPGLPRPAQVGLAEELANDLLGYGPLEQYFSGPQAHRVTEIKVVNPRLIRIEMEGSEAPATDDNGKPVVFRDDQHCRDVLDRMLAPTGRRIDLSSPRVKARLPDGSRLMAHIHPVAVDGTTFTVRRFRRELSLEQLVAGGAMNKEILEFLSACVKGRLNMVVSGGTSSGKTTILNALAACIPEDESIITIEDPAELQLQHGNVRRLEARPRNVEGEGEITQRDLVADALRMAPKRIVVGECREGEAFDMMQAMNTGHDGSLTTGHANSADDMLNRRLVNMIQMAGMGLPYEAIIGQIAGAVDLVVHVCKDRTGRRRVDHICETTGVVRTGALAVVGTGEIYRFDSQKETWVRGKHPFSRAEKLHRQGVRLPTGVIG